MVNTDIHGCCNSCGELAKIITVELYDEEHSYGSYGYQYHPYTYEEQVTECCEDVDWEQVDVDEDEV